MYKSYDIYESIQEQNKSIEHNFIFSKQSFLSSPSSSPPVIGRYTQQHPHHRQCYTMKGSLEPVEKQI